MNTKPSAFLTRALLATSLAFSLVALTGCGPKVSGLYIGTAGHSVFDKIDLQPGGKVVVTLVGIDHEATYEVKGSTVVVNNQGQLSELKIDSHGCLVDALGGTYCKDGKAAGTATSATPVAKEATPGGLSGVYEAKEPGGAVMRIEFPGGNVFRVSVGVPGAMTSAMPGTYVVHGDHLLLTVTGDNEVLDLTRNGNTLEGVIDGDKLSFTRK